MILIQPSSVTIPSAALFLSLCLLISLTACASTPQEIVVSEPTAIVLTKEVLVPVPASLSAEVKIPQLPENADTLELGATYRATVIRLMVANMQLAEISKLGK